MKTATNAHLGLAIGVLSGIATREELTNADVIVEDASQVFDIIEKHQ